MDKQTVQRYDDFAANYVAEWMPQTPVIIRNLVSKWFLPGSAVLDIGSGSGRDVGWLINQGFRAEGVDASLGLLNEARLANPNAVFRQDSLPRLESISDSSVDNILCSAVLMHLPAGDIPAAIGNMLRVLRAGGRVICSVRPSRQNEPRESDGRLYTDISPEELAGFFVAQGAVMLEIMTSDRKHIDTTWHTVVIEKPL